MHMCIYILYHIMCIYIYIYTYAFICTYIHAYSYPTIQHV